jgi:hypothetical protein
MWPRGGRCCDEVRCGLWTEGAGKKWPPLLILLPIPREQDREGALQALLSFLYNEMGRKKSREHLKKKMFSKVRPVQALHYFGGWGGDKAKFTSHTK